MHATALHVLGQHPVGEGWFDAVDVIVRTAAGDEVVLGFRTRDYVDRVLLEGADPPWSDGYVPLPVTFDPTEVAHWDFGEVLWVGPADHPCLVWSNAEALSIRALVTMLGSAPLPNRAGRLLAGPRGDGLPTPDQVGIGPVDASTWVELG